MARPGLAGAAGSQGDPGFLRGEPRRGYRLGCVAAPADLVGAVPAGAVSGDDRRDGHSQTAVDGPRASAIPADAAIAGDDRPGEREAAAAAVPRPFLLGRPEHSLRRRLFHRPARVRSERTRHLAVHVNPVLTAHNSPHPSPELCHHRLHLLPEPGHLPGNLVAQPHRQAAGRRPPIPGDHRQRDHGMGYRPPVGTPEHGGHDRVRALGFVGGQEASARRLPQSVPRRCPGG